MCKNIFYAAEMMRKELDAPVRLFPKCHPRSHFDVFVDCKKRTVVLSCAKCDRTIATVKVKR